jgi:hypothetical protein
LLFEREDPVAVFEREDPFAFAAFDDDFEREFEFEDLDLEDVRPLEPLLRLPELDFFRELDFLVVGMPSSGS